MDKYAYRCFLPDLAGFAPTHCARPDYQQRPQTAGKAKPPVKIMAEREGFEPSIHVNVYTLSRRVPSAARTSLLPAVKLLSKTCVKGIYLCNIFQGVFAREKQEETANRIISARRKTKGGKTGLPVVFYPINLYARDGRGYLLKFLSVILRSFINAPPPEADGSLIMSSSG